MEKQVRCALPDEEEQIMDLCRRLHQENGLFTLHEGRVRDIIRMATSKKGGFLGVIGEPGEKIEGIICMIISLFWYSEDWHLEELFSYVHPDFRKSTNAKNLISFAKRCSDELKIPLVIGVISNDRTEQKVRLYQRQFDKANGAFFVYGSPWQEPKVVNGKSH